MAQVMATLSHGVPDDEGGPPRVLCIFAGCHASADTGVLPFCRNHLLQSGFLGPREPEHVERVECVERVERRSARLQSMAPSEAARRRREDSVPDSVDSTASASRGPVPAGQQPQPQRQQVLRRPSQFPLDAYIYNQPGVRLPPPPGLSLPTPGEMAAVRARAAREAAAAAYFASPAAAPVLPPAAPALLYVHMDPRIHWSQPHTAEWHAAKQEEIRARGGRKANFGKAAQRQAANKRRDQLQQLANEVLEEAAQRRPGSGSMIAHSMAHRGNAGASLATPAPTVATATPTPATAPATTPATATTTTTTMTPMTAPLTPSLTLALMPPVGPPIEVPPALMAEMLSRDLPLEVASNKPWLRLLCIVEMQRREREMLPSVRQMREGRE